MNVRLKLAGQLCILSFLALPACGETSQESTEVCVPECSEDELCINGECQSSSNAETDPDSQVDDTDNAPAIANDLNCVEIFQCVTDAECPNEKDSCYREKCVSHGTDKAEDRFMDFVNCFRENNCPNASNPNECLKNNCQSQLQKCAATRQPASSDPDNTDSDVNTNQCTPNMADESCVQLSISNEDTMYAAAGIENSEGSNICGTKLSDPNYSGTNPQANFNSGSFSFQNNCSQPVHLRWCLYNKYAVTYTDAHWWCSYKTNISPGASTSFSQCYNDLGPDDAGRYQRGLMITPSSNPRGCVQRCPGGLSNCEAFQIRGE